MNKETEVNPGSVELAKDAIKYVLERVKVNPDIRYHMGAFTESFERLKAAHSALNGISEEAIEEVIFGYRMNRKAAAQVLEAIRTVINEQLGRPGCSEDVRSLINQLRELIETAH